MMCGERVLQLNSFRSLAAHADGDRSGHGMYKAPLGLCGGGSLTRARMGQSPVPTQGGWNRVNRVSTGNYAAARSIRRASTPSSTVHKALAAVSAATSAFSAVSGLAFTRVSNCVRHTCAWTTSAVACNVK